MHSLAMATDILQAALREAAKHPPKKIRRIGVKLGEEHFAESDSIAFCLEALVKGTQAEGAKLDIEAVATPTVCPKCGYIFPKNVSPPYCPECGDRDRARHHDHDPLEIILEME